MSIWGIGAASSSRRAGIYIVTGGGSGGGGSPGTFDPLQSTLVISNSTVVSGSSRTATLTTKDAAGNQLGTGGLTVVPTKSGGTATGTLSSVTDVGNGTYTWTYTGVLSGTAQTLNATVNGTALTSTLPTISVTPGAISAVTSVMSISSSTAPQGGSAVTATFTGKDAAGNLAPTGSPTIVFYQATIGVGVSVIGIGSTVNDGSNVYHASITPTTTGTATDIGVTVTGTPSTSTVAFTVTAASVADFEEKFAYSSTAQMQAASHWAGDTVWGTTVWDNSVSMVSGGNSMKITFADATGNTNTTGTNGRCGSNTPSEVNITIPGGPVTELWGRLRFKFSSNFETKVSTVWSPVCTSNPELKFLFGRVTPSSRYQINVGGNASEDTIDVGYPNNQSATQYTKAPAIFLRDGAEHYIDWHWKTGAGTGVVEEWHDGVKKVTLTGLTTGETSIYGLAIVRNLNQGPDSTQTLHFGQIALWFSDPGF